MASNKLAKISPETKQSARDLFMRHRPMNEISATLSISTAVLAKWRTDEGWVAARDAADEIESHDKIARRKMDLLNIEDDAIQQIKRAVKKIVDNPEEPSLNEAKTLSDIVEKIDKVSRLDRQQATENVNVRVEGKLSVDRIREIVKSDAFLTPETHEQ